VLCFEVGRDSCQANSLGGVGVVVAIEGLGFRLERSRRGFLIYLLMWSRRGGNRREEKKQELVRREARRVGMGHLRAAMEKCNAKLVLFHFHWTKIIILYTQILQIILVIP